MKHFLSGQIVTFARRVPVVAVVAAATLAVPAVASAQITFSFGGAAQGTHTGPGSFTGSGSVPGGPPPCGSGNVPEVEQQTLIAASGDAIDEQTNGLNCTQPGGFFVNTATYTITGGTGRFATAMGSGSYVSIASFPNGFSNPGIYTFSQEGTITLNRGNGPGHPEPFREQGSGTITIG